jgi:hypothetical protein
VIEIGFCSTERRISRLTPRSWQRKKTLDFADSLSSLKLLALTGYKPQEEKSHLNRFDGLVKSSEATASFALFLRLSLLIVKTTPRRRNHQHSGTTYQ